MKTRSTTRPGSLRQTSLNSLADLMGELKKTLKGQLARQFRAELPAVLVARAIDEAEQVAEGSGFPHLFLPELAAEQVRRIRAVVTRDEPAPRLHQAA
jgi:hypothetical protein